MSLDVKLAAQRAQARIGSVIKDKWQLDSLLGVGGMACVYAATHRNKKRAAIKMLHRELSSDTEIRERFLREGYLANSVGHRGAVAVDDDDVAEDGSAFIVMELLDGETLDQRWRRSGNRLPLDEVLAACDQVLETLAAAHDKGVVHRDLKPENLLLTRDGVMKLLDFGIGRVKELKGIVATTLSGAAMGTPAFMAPEQARGRWQEVDERTDLWALGATVFTLLSGEHVHEGDTVNEVLAQACRRPARSLRQLRPDLPAAAVALVDKALAFSKSERFADARAMQAEVRAVYATVAHGHFGALTTPDLPPSLSAPTAVTLQTRPQPTSPRAEAARLEPWTSRAGETLRRRPALWLGALGVLTVLLGGLLARALSGTKGPSFSERPGSAPPRLDDPPAPSPPAPIPVNDLPLAGEQPPVAVEALPEEQPERPARRGTTGAAASKKVTR